MNAIPLPNRPSSWDRDMQGLDEDPESENLTALGMHLMAEKEDEEEEEEDDLDEGASDDTIDSSDDEEEEEEDDEDKPAELDELAELDRLAAELLATDSAVLIDEEE